MHDSGSRTIALPSALFDSLAEELGRAGFFAMDSLYAVPMTDQSSIILSATRQGQRKVVVRYGDPEQAPASLQGLIDRLDGAGARLFGHVRGQP